MVLQAMLFSIPEALAISWLAYALSGSGSGWKRILIIGTLTGIISLLYRPFLDSYVLNVLIYAGILIMLLCVFKVVTLWESVTAVSLAVPIYTLIEFLNLTIISSIFRLEPLDIMSNLLLKSACFSSQLIITVLIAYLLCKYEIGLFSKDLEA